MSTTPRTSQKSSAPLSKPMRAITYFKNKTAPVWGMPMSMFRSRNIAMFHMGRCGSTVLGDLLDQHPKIQWNGEIYCQYIRKWREQKASNVKSNINLSPDPLVVLKQRMFATGSKNFGCEIKFHHLVEGHLDIQNFIDRLNQKDFLYIILKRDNFLRSIVSNTIMYYGFPTKKTHIKTSEKSILKRIYIDIYKAEYNGYKKPLIEHLDIHRDNHIALEKMLSNQRCLKLNFEDDISTNPNDAYLKVCEFINIEPKEVPIRLKKTNPFPLSEIIINYDEVKAYLKNTEYAWMCS